MVNFFNESGKEYSFDARLVKSILKNISADFNKHFEYLNVILLTDDALLEMNTVHLNHNYYTDILSFDYAEDNNPVQGELYISFDRIYENAKRFDQQFDTELLRVVIHGILHLVGMDDQSTEQKELMQATENKYLIAIVPRETLNNV